MSMPIRFCVVEDCERRRAGRGYCRMHYSRWWRTGSPYITRKDSDGTPIWRRIIRRLIPDETGRGCWVWNGSVNHAGYGIIGYQGRSRLVHRLIYVGIFGDTDRVLHHLCREPRCVNPWHLQPLTRKEHMRLHALEDCA